MYTNTVFVLFCQNDSFQYTILFLKIKHLSEIKIAQNEFSVCKAEEGLSAQPDCQTGHPDLRWPFFDFGMIGHLFDSLHIFPKFRLSALPDAVVVHQDEKDGCQSRIPAALSSLFRPSRNG